MASSADSGFSNMQKPNPLETCRSVYFITFACLIFPNWAKYFSNDSICLAQSPKHVRSVVLKDNPPINSLLLVNPRMQLLLLVVFQRFLFHDVEIRMVAKNDESKPHSRLVNTVGSPVFHIVLDSEQTHSCDGDSGSECGSVELRSSNSR